MTDTMMRGNKVNGARWIRAKVWRPEGSRHWRMAVRNGDRVIASDSASRHEAVLNAAAHAVEAARAAWFWDYSRKDVREPK